MFDFIKTHQLVLNVLSNDGQHLKAPVPASETVGSRRVSRMISVGGEGGGDLIKLRIRKDRLEQTV